MHGLWQPEGCVPWWYQDAIPRVWWADFKRKGLMKNGSLSGFLDLISLAIAPDGPSQHSALRARWLLPAIVCTLLSAPAAEPSAGASNAYEKWTNGPPSDPGFFPLAVWVQAP